MHKRLHHTVEGKTLWVDGGQFLTIKYKLNIYIMAYLANTFWGKPANFLESLVVVGVRYLGKGPFVDTFVKTSEGTFF